MTNYGATERVPLSAFRVYKTTRKLHATKKGKAQGWTFDCSTTFFTMQPKLPNTCPTPSFMSIPIRHTDIRIHQYVLQIQMRH